MAILNNSSKKGLYKPFRISFYDKSNGINALKQLFLTPAPIKAGMNIAHL